MPEIGYKSGRPRVKVVLLAAGLSNRLRPLTEKIPKCLIKIGGKSILDWALESFERFGLKEAVIVTGHGAKEIQKNLNSKPYKVSIRCVFNPEYAEKNNIYSLWYVKQEFENGFILFNSDVFCDPQIVRKVVNADHSDLLVIDDTKCLAREEMKVKVEAGIIKNISKEINPEDADGEYIGIARFSGQGSAMLSRILDEFVTKGKTTLFYEAAFQKMADFFNIFKLSTQNLPWVEIDDYEDLKKAKDWVLPEILKRSKLGTSIKNY